MQMKISLIKVKIFNGLTVNRGLRYRWTYFTPLRIIICEDQAYVTAYRPQCEVSFHRLSIFSSDA